MVEAFLVVVKRHQHREDRMAVLARGDAPRREALAVAHAVDVVDDRDFRIARQQEIGVHRMGRPALDGAHRRDQRLADHLAAEHPLPARLRRAAAEQVEVELFEIEDREKVGNGGRHGAILSSRRNDATLQPAMLGRGLTSEATAAKWTAGRKRRTDVLIAGGGFAGLALAIALRQGLGESFAVTVADPALASPQSKDLRASAIAAAARRLFETVGAWQAVADKAQPILDMVVTDSKLDDAVRPTFLTFDGEVEEGEPFAHMIENRHLIDALVARAREEGVELRADAVESFRGRRASVAVSLKDGNERFGAAAGRRRRRAFGGARAGRHRDRTAGTTSSPPSSRPSRMSATTTAAPRSISCPPGRSRSCRSPASAHRSSGPKRRPRPSAWSRCRMRNFIAELEKRFGLNLGDIEVAGPRRAFPLGLFTARSFIADRIALIGDAAHIIHPIAGQGLNMGLRDAAALAEVIADAARLGLDPGAPIRSSAISAGGGSTR